MSPADTDASPPPPPARPAYAQFLAAPLALPAIAVTLGLIADRELELALGAELLLAAVGIVLGLVRVRPTELAAALACLGVGAAWHHVQIRALPADDISRSLGDQGRVARVRGVLLEDPVARFPDKVSLLEPARRGETDRVALAVDALSDAAGAWAPASGTVRLTVEREESAPGTAPTPLLGLRGGDEVEVLGRLRLVGAPKNPGEWDERRAKRDLGVRADLWVRQGQAVVRLDGEVRSYAGWMARARRGALDRLAASVPKSELGPAAALLLGDQQAMEAGDWQAYVRTGVVHALVISGQHLAVLAGACWLVGRVLGVRRRPMALGVLALIVGYTLLTGIRPSSVRATAVVAAFCLGLVVRRPTSAANSLCLAWLVVIAIHAAAPFQLGCQLSFLTVFLLIWGVGPMLVPAPPSAVEELIDQSRSPLARFARSGARLVAQAYLVNLALSAATWPVLLTTQNVVSPAGLLIGPAVVAASGVALVGGLGLLAGGAALPAASLVLAAPLRLGLAGCGALVKWADRLPGGVVYSPGPPAWWLVGFYAVLVMAVLAPDPWRRRLLLGLGTFVALSLIPGWGGGRAADETRVTLLAVGKGGCIVIETHDSRTLIYDVGTTAGPTAVRRVVAPYLWGRGVARVDELFLSHADFDHFNGVAELARRFPVGRVTLTPSFRDKPTREVEGALNAIAEFKLPVRVASAGELSEAGGVTLTVLHPPKLGPPGTENERSLVLEVGYAGQTVLLTGDLEQKGTTELLRLPPRHCAALVAPHHGSRAALPPSLVEWASPQLILASRGAPYGNSLRQGDAGPVPVWDTDSGGALTLRMHASGVVAEKFLGGERLALRPQRGRKGAGR